MFNLHYSIVDNCTVLAFNPLTRKEEWRRSVRTYFRNTSKMPIIKLQVTELTVSAIWMGSSVVIDASNGKVLKYLRTMQLNGQDSVIVI
ncbi:MAG: hypothetical protein AAF705_02180 [Bacteroidota bacterium]